MRPMQDDPPEPAALALQRWGQRLFWLGAGALALLAGVIGIVVPLLPTTPPVLVAALRCLRGCLHCERQPALLRSRVSMPTGTDIAPGCVSHRVSGA